MYVLPSIGQQRNYRALRKLLAISLCLSVSTATAQCAHQVAHCWLPPSVVKIWKHKYSFFFWVFNSNFIVFFFSFYHILTGFSLLCLFQFLFRHLFIIRIVYSDNLQLTGLSLNGIKLELHIVRVQTISRSLSLSSFRSVESDRDKRGQIAREIDREHYQWGGKVKKPQECTILAMQLVFLLILITRTPWRIRIRFRTHTRMYVCIT